jgi:hypothetical protein
MVKLAENSWWSKHGTYEGFTELDGVAEALELVEEHGKLGTIQSRAPGARSD